MPPASNDTSNGPDLPDGLAFRLVIEIGADGAVTQDWAVKREGGPFSPRTLEAAHAAVMKAQGEIGAAALADGLRARIGGADALLFDGTVLHDDDMIRAGVGTKTGWRMGHVPMTGEGGSIAALSDVAIGRRVFVHINNTNPVLVEGSEARRQVEAAGWTVAHDGLTLTLS